MIAVQRVAQTSALVCGSSVGKTANPKVVCPRIRERESREEPQTPKAGGPRYTCSALAAMAKCRYRAVQPQSMGTAEPVMHCATSVARYTTRAATSSGSSMRFRAAGPTMNFSTTSCSDRP